MPQRPCPASPRLASEFKGHLLSPLHLKLRPADYGEFPAHSDHLPGLIADSLPDGWGLLLMARLFRRSARALAGEAGAALRELALAGGAPQGAR